MVDPANERKRLLAIVHIAQQALGLDDSTYRAVLWEQIKVDSAAQASVAQLKKIVRHFEGLGFKLKGKGRRASPQVGKIKALWAQLAAAGVVKYGSELALRHYVKRMTGVEHLGWLKPQQASTIIETLKSWGAREGVT